jgi:hypothetical protein
LFERQCFEDDGIFDWDIIKKAQQIGPDANATDANAESARATQEGAQNLNKDSNQEGITSNKASMGPNVALGGSIQREGTNSVGQKAEENVGRDENDNKEPGQRRSIISSIRYFDFPPFLLCDLFIN